MNPGMLGEKQECYLCAMQPPRWRNVCGAGQQKMKQYFIFDFLIRKISRVLRCKPGTAYKEASILPMYFCAMKPPPPKSHCSKYKTLNNLALSFHLQEAKQTTVQLDGGKNGETETKAFFCFHEMPENGFWLSVQVLMSIGVFIIKLCGSIVCGNLLYY